MAEQLVRCRKCGKVFDANQGGCYDRTLQGYLCGACMNTLSVRGRKMPSTGGTVAKLAFGALFIVTAFTMDDAGGLGVSIIIGLALIAWGLLPWLRIRREQTAAQQSAAAERERLRAEKREAEQRELSEQKICPACGAPTKGRVCEYCGTPLPRSK